MRVRGRLVLVVAAMLAVGLAQGGKKEGEPAKVTVQHILISFGRKIPDKKIERSKEEARTLAEQVLEKARKAATPEEFTALVQEYTDDSAPGIYVLTNDDAPVVPNSRKRRDMVPSFGDVAFALQVGEVGMAEYHAALSPYGWHVIKRLE
jgi:parvulin-like peptidyl-prolyl isomerase